MPKQVVHHHLKERKKIGSVQRAIDILNLFDSQSQELGMTDIAEALRLHKSTVAGLMATLEVNGYLDQNPLTRKYRLGLKLVERAFIALNQLEVRQIAQPHLRALRDAHDESVNLGIRDGIEVVYIERLAGNQSLGIHGHIGKRAPLHCTGLGKALLAWLPPEEVESLIAQCNFTALTEKTITDPQQYRDELQRTRERGFAIDDEENELGGRCVAAPIFDHRGHTVAAISISVPLPRIPPARIPEFGDSVRATAKAISTRLGYMQRPY